MQAFIRNLCVSNKDTLQDVIGACNKILNWVLTTHAQSVLNYDDVETLLKASIYVEECLALYGGMQMLQALIELAPELVEFFNAQKHILEEKCFIAHVLYVILKTPRGIQHLPVIEEILRQRYDKEEIEKFIKAATTTTKKDATLMERMQQVQHSRLLLALQHLFQLPAAQFELGMTRLVAHLHFQVLGYVFLEPELSVYFKRCCILVQFICSSLSNCTIASYFIDSMQQTAAYSDEGRLFYWQCLENKLLARHLRDFCINYFENLTETDEVPDKLENFNTEKICYLFSTALNMQSPCRLAYQRAINKANINGYYLNLIRRHIIIFHV